MDFCRTSDGCILQVRFLPQPHVPFFFHLCSQTQRPRLDWWIDIWLWSGCWLKHSYYYTRLSWWGSSILRKRVNLSHWLHLQYVTSECSWTELIDSRPVNRTCLNLVLLLWDFTWQSTIKLATLRVLIVSNYKRRSPLQSRFRLIIATWTPRLQNSIVHPNCKLLFCDWWVTAACYTIRC